MFLSAPPWVYAFVLAVVAGTLLASGRYLGGLVAGGVAVVLMAAWNRAVRRGESDQSGLK